MIFDENFTEKSYRQASRSRRFRLRFLGLSFALIPINMVVVPQHAYTAHSVVACLVLVFLSWNALRLLECPRCHKRYYEKNRLLAANIAAVECEHCRLRL